MTGAEQVRLLAMYALATYGGAYTVVMANERFGIIGAIILLCLYAKIFCAP